MNAPHTQPTRHNDSSTLRVPADPAWRGEGMTIQHGWQPSPWGPALLATSERGLLGVFFEPSTTARIAQAWPDARLQEAPEVTAALARRLFTLTKSAEGERRRIDPQLRLLVRGTAFQVAVWRALLTIPLGERVSYKDLAARAGHPTAVRAVASAVGRNPLSFVLPCHCVVRADGGIGGYHWGVDLKRQILAWEDEHVQD